MKNTLIKSIYLLICIYFLLSFQSCGNDNNDLVDVTMIVSDELTDLINNDLDSTDKILILYDKYYMQNRETINKYSFIERFAKEGWERFGNETAIRVIEYGGNPFTWIAAIPDRFRVIYSEIMAGIMPSVIQFTDGDFPFYITKGLLLSLDIYPFYGDDSIMHIEHNGSVYGYGLRMGPTCLLMYNKDYIIETGVNDPVDLWLEGKWDWTTWLELLGIVKPIVENKKYDLLFDSHFLKQAIVASNGVDYVIINDDGKLTFGLDDRYIEALELYGDLRHKYGYIDPQSTIYQGAMYEADFMDGKAFMTYGVQTSVLMGDQNFAGGYDRCPDYIGKICFPRGPGLSEGIASRDVNEKIYVSIPISCKNPEVAAKYVEWLFSSQELLETRRELETVKLYNGSADLYDYAKEWEWLSVGLSIYAYGGEVRSMIEDNDAVVLVNHKGVEFQSILDKYLNLFN